MIYYISNQLEIAALSHDEIKRVSHEEALTFLDSLAEIGVDTETTGFDPYTCKMLLAQFGNEEHQVVIDVADGDYSLIHEIFKRNKEKVFIFQNAKFDLRFFMYIGIYVDKVYDTFLAEQVLYNGIRDHKKGLDALAERYTLETLDKSIRGKIHAHGNTYEVIRYAAYDVKVLPIIKRKQIELARERQLINAIKLENLFVVPLAYTEMCGLGIDQELWLKKVEGDEAILQSKEDVLNKWILDRKDQYMKYVDTQLDLFSTELRTNINWNSSAQLIPIFEGLGVDVMVKDKETGKMKKSIEESVLASQRDVSELVSLYLEFTKASKVVSTYGRAFLNNVNKATGRIHTSFTQILKTGRMSSSPNIQNIPAVPEDNDRKKGIYERECFVPKKGNVFIDSDYSSQESVILANFSQEPKLIEFYLSGASDLHSFVAKEVYPDEIGNTPLEDIKKKFKALRQNAKAANFALSYGGNGDTIARNLGVDSKVGYAVEKAFFDAFPELNDYFTRCKKAVLDNGYVLVNSISGRKVYAHNFQEYKELEEEISTPGFWDTYRLEKQQDSDYFVVLKDRVSRYFRIKGAMERESMNYPIQGSAGEQTKLSLVYLYKYLKEHYLLNTVLIVNLIHDEVLLECPEDIAEQMAKVLQDCMEQAALKYCKTIKLTATPVIDTLWRH